MKFLKRIFMWFLYLLGALCILGIGIYIYTKFAPQFGDYLSGDDEQTYASSPNFKDGKFQNLEPTVISMSFKEGVKTTKGFLFNKEAKLPPKQYPMATPDFSANNTDEFKITWFGHSTIILQVSGKTILLDPMLGKTPSPVSFLGSERFWDSLPVLLDSLPHIDAIVISHDHYDHLDYETVLKLKTKVNEFFMPLAVGRHLRKWGVPNEKIHELDWWDEITFGTLKFVCTPSRHFSGRGLDDRNTSLWSSWIIESPKQKLFFSGDGGYGKHFKVIGEKYGPFDFAFMECGQYNKNWHLIHMMPEESVQAAKDIQAKIIMPIHWGAFTLALHSWTDPVERFIAQAKIDSVLYTTPRIGESFFVDALVQTEWWKLGD